MADTARSDLSVSGASVKCEIKRLTQDLSMLRKLIQDHEPATKPFTPNVFNRLEPYHDLSFLDKVIKASERVQWHSVSRKTAIDVCDPTQSLALSTQVDEKPSETEFTPIIKPKIKRHELLDEGRPPKQGSTRLPAYPHHNLDNPEYASRELLFTDIPKLRRELRERYLEGAEERVKEDFERTKQDTNRIGLDKIDEVHPINRENMRNMLKAYLQNTES